MFNWFKKFFVKPETRVTPHRKLAILLRKGTVGSKIENGEIIIVSKDGERLGTLTEYLYRLAAGPE